MSSSEDGSSGSSSSSSSSSTPPSSSPSSSDSPTPPSQKDNGSSSPPSSDSPAPPSKKDNGSSSPSSSNSPAPPSQNDNGSSSPSPPSKNSDSPSPPSSSNNDNDDNDNNNSSNSNNSNNNNRNSNNNSKSSPRSPPLPPPNSGRLRNPPPPPPQSLSSSSSSGNDSSGNEKVIIAGVVVGVGLLLIVMVVFLVSCYRKKKKKQSHDQMNYYRDNSLRNTIDYYNSGQQGNWNTAHNGDHAVKIPPPPAPASMSSEQWPAVPPPPPPAMMSSSDTSSLGFSGPHGAPLPPPHPSISLGFNKSSFSYEDLAAATGGFIKSNLLGQGGFGYVHKGVLPNGKEIAVKSLKSGSGQGEREFQAEVEIISRVHHRHLVSLVGYCIADSQRMLVYEFVPNNSLEHYLYAKDDSSIPVMNFETRLKIALGSAKGFAYLHEDCHPRIIHRDIKAANILLDYNFEPKVADFGLAKLSSDNYTHVSTRIMGTFGYLAPEYASTGKLTEKSDVYSYGIVLLELITGRRPVDITRDDDDSLVDWARPILTNATTEGGSFEELVDPRLENNYDPHEMLRMVACAAACIRHSARRRPKMSQIVRALEGDVSLDDLNHGIKTSSSQVFSSSGSSDHEGSYNNLDVKRFRKGATTSSQEFTSSEHDISGESQEIRSNVESRIRTP